MRKPSKFKTGDRVVVSPNKTRFSTIKDVHKNKVFEIFYMDYSAWSNRYLCNLRCGKIIYSAWEDELCSAGQAELGSIYGN